MTPLQQGSILTWDQQSLNNTVGIGIVIHKYRTALHTRLFQISSEIDLNDMRESDIPAFSRQSDCFHHSKGISEGHILHTSNIAIANPIPGLVEEPLYRCIANGSTLVFEKGTRSGNSCMDRDYSVVDPGIALAGEIEHTIGFAHLPKLYGQDVVYGRSLRRRIEWCNKIMLIMRSFSAPTATVHPSHLPVVRAFLEETLLEYRSRDFDQRHETFEKLTIFYNS